MRYIVQMEEIINDDDNMETFDIWECFGEYGNLKDAKEVANELANNIRNHSCQYTEEVSDKNNWIGVCISKYYSDSGRGRLPKNARPGGLVDVIEIAEIPPEVWN